VGTTLGRPGLVATALAVLAGAYGLSWTITIEDGRRR
jgi:hypothetical protein